MAEETTTSSYYSKIPTFDGRKRNWRFYKTKMKTYLSRKDCIELMGWTEDVPTAATITAIDPDTNQPVNNQVRQDEMTEVSKQNMKAGGILLDGIQSIRAPTSF